MRMALCWPSLILLIYAFVIHANAAATSYTLSTELTSFIPTCAQECFISFLDTNFPTSACSSKPMLDCLCSHNSTTGYTVGEGAVQCIISEINIGFCKGDDAKDSVVHDAYGMCAGQPSALPNTHATITATLVIQTTMPSIVLVAPAPTTFLTSGSKTSSVVTITSTKSSTSNLVTETSRPLPSNTASNTVSSVPAASETASPEPILTKNQIVGITVASIGGGAVAVGLLILFICCRRRRNKRARESDLIPFQLEPNHVMDTKKHKYKSFKGPTERIPGGTRNGVAAKIPPRIPPRLDTSSPNMFSRRSIRPDTIGLAISPEQNVSVEKQQRRSSKLLPEKPTLTLKVPQQPEKPNNGFSFNQPIVHPSAISRQSTATQFEEDYDESADTAVAADDSWTAKSTDQILDAGSGKWQTIRKVEQEPAYLVPGGEGYHWRPGQNPSTATTNPDYYIRPLSVGGRKIGSFSQPRIPNAYARQQDQQQLSIPENARPTTTSSSIYSVRGSVASADQDIRTSNSNSRPNRFSYQQQGPYDAEVVSPEDQNPEPRIAGTDMALSPVVESPASGRSPVSYPKIPPPGAGGSRRLSQSTMRMVPPPPQPDFTKALGAGKPWRQAEIAAQVERERMARQAQAQSQVQGQVGMQGLRSQGPGHQRQRSRDLREAATTPSPVIFAFPAPPPPALVPGRSQTTSPPAIPSPYLFRSASQSKLVPPPLLRSRSQLQREARTPPPQYQTQNQAGQQSQLQTVTESPPQKKLTPPPLLRSRSQLQKEGRTPSPVQNQNQSQSQQQQQIQNATSPPLQKEPSPPPLLRSRSQIMREARTLPPLKTSLQPQPEPPNDPIPQSSTSTYPRPNTLSHQQTSSSQTLPQSATSMYPRPNPLSSHPSITFTRSSSLLSQRSQGSTATNFTQTSTSSSLLQKRLGSQKASAMTPSLTLKNEEDHKKQIAKWRVLKREEIENAKKEGWRPMLGREGGDVGGAGGRFGGNGGAKGEGNGDVYLSPGRDGLFEFERTELPTTPGWVPKLTPTRRGDELFLSVQ